MTNMIWLQLNILVLGVILSHALIVSVEKFCFPRKCLRKTCFNSQCPIQCSVGTKVHIQEEIFLQKIYCSLMGQFCPMYGYFLVLSTLQFFLQKCPHKTHFNTLCPSQCSVGTKVHIQEEIFLQRRYCSLMGQFCPMHGYFLVLSTLPSRQPCLNCGPKSCI